VNKSDKTGLPTPDPGQWGFCRGVLGDDELEAFILAKAAQLGFLDLPRISPEPGVLVKETKK